MENEYDNIKLAYEEVTVANETDAENFWESLSYDDKCNAFHAVVSRLVQAEITDKRSYRGTLYDVFQFGPEMYIRGMDCGYITLHNSITTEKNEK